MKTLLKKEFRLALHPAAVMFLALSAMVIIPNYPYYVVFFYTCLGVFFTCLNGRENQDIMYTVMLPVRKRDVVSARICLTVIMQILQAVVAVPFMLVRRGLPVGQNQVGMEANLAMLGIGFILMGIFNVVFYGIYYKTPVKVGKAFVTASAVMFVCIVAAEVLAHFPIVSEVLDSYEPQYFIYRAAVLTGGIIVYAALTAAAAARGRKDFEKYDLE